MMKCPRCGYEWRRRVEQPKRCPKCTYRLDHYNLEEIKKDMKGKAVKTLQETGEPIKPEEIEKLADELLHRYIERVEG